MYMGLHSEIVGIILTPRQIGVFYEVSSVLCRIGCYVNYFNRELCCCFFGCFFFFKGKDLWIEYLGERSRFVFSPITILCG